MTASLDSFGLRVAAWLGATALVTSGLAVVAIAPAQAEATGASVSGTVTDSASTPIENACVAAKSVSTGSASYAYTATDGTYTFTSVEPGTYRVSFDVGCGSQPYLGQWYRNEPDESSADAVVLNAGDSATGIDAQLADGGGISGTVKDTTTSAALGGICVDAEHPDRSGYGGSATTDASGNYSIDGLATGAYIVTFQDCASGDYVTSWYEDAKSSDTASTVAVTAGQTTPSIDQNLALGGEIQGHVTDTQGTHLQNICVSARSQQPGDDRSSFTSTAADGSYTLHGVVPGTDSVQFSDCSGGSYLSEYYDNQPSSDTATGVTVQSSSTTTGIDAELTNGGSVSGTITSGSSGPIPGICASLTSATSSFVLGSQPSGSDGRYTIRSVPDGTYKVYFSDCAGGDYLSQWYRNQPSAATAGQITVANGADTPGIDADMAQGGSIGGTITDAGGHPLPSICVDALPSGNVGSGARADSDANGHYVLHGLAPGSYTVRFAVCPDQGYVSQTYDETNGPIADPITVAAGSRSGGIDAQLTAGGTIAGHVTDAGGAGVAKICVYANSLSGGGSASTLTDATGHYTLRGVEAGDNNVSFSDCNEDGNYVSQGYGSNPVAVTAGDVTSGVDATLRQGGSISGTLTLSSGEPSSYECVSVYDAPDDEVTGSSSDVSGHYVVHGVDSGSYRLLYASDCSGSGGQWYHGRTSYDAADPVTVTAGTDSGGIDDVIGATRANGPTVHLTATPDAGGQPLDSSVDVTFADAAAADLTYTVDFGDGTAPSKGQNSSPYSPLSLDHTFAHKGTYKVSVSASDSAGNTGSSSTTVTVNPALPSAPENVSASAGDREADVSWSTPTTDGGDPITSYAVTASPGGATVSIDASAPKQADFAGLTNGVAYTFTVAAVTDVGTGPASDPSNSVVPAAPTTTTVTASPNPAVYARTVTLSATVAPSTDAPGQVSGEVTFYDGTDYLGTGVVNQNGVAMLDVSSLAKGTHAITARYNGDAAFRSSRSTAISEDVVTATTATALDADPADAVFGQAVTVSASVTSTTPGVTGPPSGSVRFMSGTAELATGTLDGSGVATATLPTLPVGNSAITAVYEGNGGFAGSTSAPETVSVAKAATQVDLSVDSTAVLEGVTVTLGASVLPSAPGAGGPAGSVTFIQDGNVLGTVDLSQSSIWKTGPLAAGDHTFTATYSGDQDFTGSASQALAVVATANNHEGGGSDPSKYQGGGDSAGGVADGGSSGGGTCYLNCSPGAAATWAHIRSKGPITDIWISDDLECALRHEGDAFPTSYTGTTPYGPGPFSSNTAPPASACGTFVYSNSALYGPGFFPDGPSSTPYVPVSQSPVTGSGTAADPYSVDTVVKVSSTGLELKETDTYVTGDESYTTSMAVVNNGTSESRPTVYRAIDCYLSDFDTGYGAYVAAGPACRDTVGSQDAPGSRLLEMRSSTSGTSFVAGLFSEVSGQLSGGGPLDDSTDCAKTDDAEAQAWSPDLAPGDTKVVASDLVFGSGTVSAADCHAPTLPQTTGNKPALTDQGGAGSPSENHVNCSTARPVNCATGDFWHTFSDFAIAGRGPGLRFTRTYDAQNAASDGSLGHGWSNNYGMSAEINTDGSVTIHEETGSSVTFDANDGLFTAPAKVLASLRATPDGGYDFTRYRDHLTYHFDSAGRLTAETDPNGDATTLAYTNGDLQTVTDAAGRTLQFQYTGDRIASVTDPLGRAWTFGYSAAGDLSSAVDPLGGTWYFTYDSSHRMVTMSNPANGTTTNTYNDANQVVKQVDPAGLMTTLAYAGDSSSDAGGSTDITDPHGNVTRYRYRDLELLAVTRAAGTSDAATTKYTYDPASLAITSVQDANGGLTSTSVDDHGNVIETVDPLGQVTSYTYNALDEVTSTTDPMGHVTASTYDAAGNLLSVSDAAGKTTTYVHSAAHRVDVTAVTDPDGRVVDFAYDDAGDVASSTTHPTASSSRSTLYGYDLDGERTCVVAPRAAASGVTCHGADAIEGVTSYVYDALGRLITAADPLGAVATYRYDRSGNRTGVVDPNGKIQTTAYDADGRPTRVVSGAGGSSSETSAVYDTPLGSGTCTGIAAATYCTSSLDGNGRATTDFYDARDVLIAESRPGGHSTRYTTDGVGNRLSSTTPSGQTASLSYDADGRVTAVRYSDSHTAGVSYRYDSAGHRVEMTDGTGTTTYAYDVDGRLTTRRDGEGQTVGYAYDGAGNVTALTYPNGKTVQRTYDGAGLLTGVTDWNGQTTTFAYDGDGNVADTAYPNGDHVASAYDGDQRMSKTVALRDADGSVLAGIAYTRDADGLVASETDSGALKGSIQYGYDSQNRLSRAGDQTYGYDPAGNPTDFAGTAQSFNAADELTQASSAVGVTSYTNDANGDRTAVANPDGSTESYAFDQVGRLLSVTARASTSDGGSTGGGGTGGAGTGGTGGSGTGTGGTGGSGPGTGGTGGSGPGTGGTGGSGPGTGGTGTGGAGGSGTGTGGTGGSGTGTGGGAGSSRVPAITRIAPETGPRSGGTKVTLLGSNLSGASTVRFGSHRALSVSVKSANKLVAVSPAGRGAVHVIVTTTHGTSSRTVQDVFTYGDMPVIDTVEPRYGRAGGGQHVTIRGSHLGQIVSVSFGNVLARSFVLRGTSVAKAVAPAGHGTVHIRVTSAYGTSRATRRDRFTFLAARPVVTGVNPQTGMAPGGTQVTIHGRHFTGASVVRFGRKRASFTVQSDRSVTAVAPPGTESVQVRVGSAAGLSRRSGAAFFTYRRVASGHRGAFAGRVLVAARSAPNASTSTSTYGYDGDGLRVSEAADGMSVTYAWDINGFAPLLLADGDTAYIYGPSGSLVETIDASNSGSAYFVTDQLHTDRVALGEAGEVVAASSYFPYGARRLTGGVPSSSVGYATSTGGVANGNLYLIDRYLDVDSGTFLTVDPAFRATRQAYVYADDDPINEFDPTGTRSISDFIGQAWIDSGAYDFFDTHTVGGCISAYVGSKVAASVSVCALVDGGYDAVSYSGGVGANAGLSASAGISGVVSNQVDQESTDSISATQGVSAGEAVVVGLDVSESPGPCNKKYYSVQPSIGLGAGYPVDVHTTATYTHTHVYR